MNPARIAVIVAALVVAVGLALFVHNMFTPAAKTPVAVAAPPQVMTRVLVAKVDLGVGTKLAPENMAWQDWPNTTLNAAYITDGAPSAAAPQNMAGAAFSKAKNTVTDLTENGGPKMVAMTGAIVRNEIFAGQPITDKSIVRAGDTSYLAVRLPEGMRAVALPLTVESGVGGFIQPGDHVDVLSTHNDTSKGGTGGLVTETVFANAQVLAIDQHTDQPKEGAALPGGTITLEVPAAAAATLSRARTQGGITLALRSYADIGPKAGGVAATDDHTVRIFRGGAPAEVVTAQ